MASQMSAVRPRMLATVIALCAAILSPCLLACFGYATLFRGLIFTTIVFFVASIMIPNEFLKKPLSMRAKQLMSAWLLAGLAHFLLGLTLLLRQDAGPLQEYAGITGMLAPGCALAALGMLSSA